MRFIILTSHELLQHKQQSKQVSVLMLEALQSLIREHMNHHEGTDNGYECILGWYGVPAHKPRNHTKGGINNMGQQKLSHKSSRMK